MNDSGFRKYHEQLVRGAVIKSLLWGLGFGAVAAFIVAFCTWMSYFKGFWLTMGIFVAVSAGGTALMYFRFFKPTDKDVARKVDALGLQERLVTMLELEGRDDYIAERQRRDAQEALQSLGMTKLKFGIALALILFVSVTGAFALAMTTVTGLSDLGLVPSGQQLIDEARGRNPRNFITVEYTATRGGGIIGESSQTIRKGETTGMVIAVPEEGYRFYRWTDGYPNPARADKGLKESSTFTAWFLPMDSDAPEDKPAGDRPSDQPNEDGNDQDKDDSSSAEMYNPPTYDYIIDWQIAYRDAFDDYYEEIMEELSGDGEISDEERKFIESYFNTLK